ncbi:MAG TPA: polyprenyl synthetase family protein [Solirubrobacterales bacterium]|nr:polyprenyl synthetase family protein [Solirubrobacterales bacterium]
MSDTAAFQSLIETVGEEVTGRLSDVESRLNELVSTRDDSASGPALETLRAGGKRLRPLLVLVCGNISAATPEQAEALVRAAVAVELVHMATLVHDDVLDDASLRRGRPTVYAEHGRDMAIATGDLLFAIAFEELTRSEDPAQVRALSAASSGLARGELIQREDAWDVNVSRERYLERCTLKTARLFEAAAQLGAHAGGRPELADALANFGARVGLAFQLADDVLDVVGSESETGKTRGADLLDGTVNLPLIVARERDPSLARIDLHAVTSPAIAAEICDRIAATDAPQTVLDEAKALVTEAKSYLDGLVDMFQRAVFSLIADQAVARTK